MFDLSLMDSERGLALLAFKVAPNQFDLNRNLAYISMKDQVLRARTLVHSALSSGIFECREETETSFGDEEVQVDVLIVGAGVGGVSAALAAAEAGLRVLLLEKNDDCFNLLKQGTNRLLSTTIYDWPALHFDCHRFPVLYGLPPCYQPDAAILHFPAAAIPAADLAEHLRLEFARLRAPFVDKLKVEYDIALKSTDDVAWSQGRRLSVSLPRTISIGPGDRRNRLFARIVVFTTGFGSEKVSERSFLANDTFWGFETLESDLQTLAVKCRERPARIAVLGGGDGGIQEVLRIAFAPQYHDLALAIKKLEETLALPSGEWRNLLQRIGTAEDNAARALMWGYAQKTVFPALDDVYSSIVDQLSSQTNADNLQKWLTAVTRAQNLCVHMYDPYAVSGRVYALNRFLMKVLTKASEGRTDGVRVMRSVGTGADAQTDLPPIDRRA